MCNNYIPPIAFIYLKCLCNEIFMLKKITLTWSLRLLIFDCESTRTNNWKEVLIEKRSFGQKVDTYVNMNFHCYWRLFKRLFLNSRGECSLRYVKFIHITTYLFLNIYYLSYKDFKTIKTSLPIFNNEDMFQKSLFMKF